MVLRPQAPPRTRLRELPLREVEIVAVGDVDGNSADVPVTGVTLDSRSVVPGDLYAALPGLNTHGARFAADAIAAGAAAVLTDPEGAALLAAAQGGNVAVPVLVVADPREQLGEVSACIYGYPARSLTMLGVTGTNGKTTLTYLLAAALQTSGRRTGVIGTIGVQVGGDALPSGRTTPEAPDVQALLAVMVEREVDVVAMEVSSHALELGRVDGLQFDIALFTNLTQDHLDFHGSMQEYFNAKARLFTAACARRAVICTDDEWGRKLAQQVALPCTTYALSGTADWTLDHVQEAANGSWRATARDRVGEHVALSSRLPGVFNQSNALGALACLVALGVEAEAAAHGVSACAGVPGRMEAVGQSDIGAFVDYAHTPDAVARVVAAARDFSTGQVLVALGCGGDRDEGKRPLMAQAAASSSDVLVITDDNPRSEDPASIRAAMLQGLSATITATVLEIPDRAAAITALVQQASPGDVVLILGKGHETGQEVAGVVTPFDDRVVLAEALQAKEREDEAADAD